MREDQDSLTPDGVSQIRPHPGCDSKQSLFASGRQKDNLKQKRAVILTKNNYTTHRQMFSANKKAFANHKASTTPPHTGKNILLTCTQCESAPTKDKRITNTKTPTPPDFKTSLQKGLSNRQLSATIC